MRIKNSCVSNSGSKEWIKWHYELLIVGNAQKCMATLQLRQPLPFYLMACFSQIYVQLDKANKPFSGLTKYITT